MHDRWALIADVQFADAPRHVFGRHPNASAPLHQLFVQGIDVASEDHRPRTGRALAAFAHEQDRVAAADRAEVGWVAVFPVDVEPEPADIPTQKRKTDIYTVMLIISFICIVTACILLSWELTKWGDFPKPWNTSEGIPNRVSEYVPTHSLWTESLV